MNKKKHNERELNQPSGSENCGDKTDRELEEGKSVLTKESDQSSGNRTPKSFGTPCHVR